MFKREKKKKDLDFKLHKKVSWNDAEIESTILGLVHLNVDVGRSNEYLEEMQCGF